MGAFFNPEDIAKLKGRNIILDTNVLSTLYVDAEYLLTFNEIFKEQILLLDPIVRLEFLRGEVTDSFFKQKTGFLQYKQFGVMTDHQDIYKKVYDNAFNIARIYAHHGKPNVPLGDVLIISRMMLYTKNIIFLTLDEQDFTTILFDRLAVVSIERKSKEKFLKLEHLVVLKFNQKKYDDCVAKLTKV